MPFSDRIGQKKVLIELVVTFDLANIYPMRMCTCCCGRRSSPPLAKNILLFHIRLPTRSYLHHYVIDVPLTNRGRVHAFKTGKALLLNGYAADICYTSPSLRCVQTADGILTGMSRRTVPMQLVRMRRSSLRQRVFFHSIRNQVYSNVI